MLEDFCILFNTSYYKNLVVTGIFLKPVTPLRNKLCKNIFNTLLITKRKNNSISFIKSFEDICSCLRLDVNYVIKNIKNVIKDLKETCLLVDDNTETELITLCLRNNQDCEMINQHNLITYAEPQ
jgi:hypothetical protein